MDFITKTINGKTYHFEKGLVGYVKSINDRNAYYQICIDTKTNEIFSEFFYDIGHSWHASFQNENVKTIMYADYGNKNDFSYQRIIDVLEYSLL